MSPECGPHDAVHERQAHMMYGALVAAVESSDAEYVGPAVANPFADWSTGYAEAVLNRLVEEGSAETPLSGAAYRPVLDDAGRMKPFELEEADR